MRRFVKNRLQFPMYASWFLLMPFVIIFVNVFLMGSSGNSLYYLLIIVEVAPIVLILATAKTTLSIIAITSWEVSESVLGHVIHQIEWQEVEKIELIKNNHIYELHFVSTNGGSINFNYTKKRIRIIMGICKVQDVTDKLKSLQ